MRLLWVENHAVFARMAGKQFLSAHEVTVLPSITAAKLALAELFDVILIDYDLDDGKGTKFVAHVQQHFPSLPMIAVSSHDEGNAALCKAGAHAVCSKLKFAGIEEIIRQMMLRRDGQ